MVNVTKGQGENLTELFNVEYKNRTGFQAFFEKVKGKRIAVLFDVNTKPYAREMIEQLKGRGCHVTEVYYPDVELVPTEDKCDFGYEKAKGSEYLLAVGSGTLNDMTKSVSTRLGVPCGVLATAASMDGYCSKGAALMRGGMKVTDTVHTPEDILIDPDIIKKAPKRMTAAGFGDIIGKYTCLTDWRLSNILNGEPINNQAFELMEMALSDCVGDFEALTKYDGDAVCKLMNALITAGTSMAICGNSRPASGSEHHQSHFLEMDFVRRGEKIPMHGLKVAIGTLVSMELYNYLRSCDVGIPQRERIWELVDELPKIDSIKEMLEKMGCPTRFSALGVRRETMEEMIEKAYTVRDRYTVLTFIHELGLTESVKPILMEKYY